MSHMKEVICLNADVEVFVINSVSSSVLFSEWPLNLCTHVKKVKLKICDAESGMDKVVTIATQFG